MSGAGARGQPGSQLGKKGGHELREARGKWDLRRPLDPGSDARCLRIPASVVEGLCGRSRCPSSTLELSRHLFPDCASENLKEPLEEQQRAGDTLLPHPLGPGIDLPRAEQRHLLPHLLPPHLRQNVSCCPS